ncbi:MAG: HypC/HybG/HupF family hydrogenase formation chaperone [Synergistetes bacterium]|nr:HypC/HybG/HupF family hydrogenase formation chaperone [Synergistota bacterium]MCX8127844.1 HypC/HybG/HupF family hydrogenase formation chaperone [Synergistota bacterium]MDW8192106.1 HypC/HybG/HupF family hydrogenase formation chaperone [Synergistota bacterium]
MCLAIPHKVIEIDGNEALTEIGGIRKKIRLDLLENVEVGDFVLVHAGFAIEKLNIEEAKEILDAWREIEKYQS